jgi:integrase/recombinase XerD
VSEALGLRVKDVDLDNLLLTIINGKGSKQRIIPCSFELRKELFRHITSAKLSGDQLLFATDEGNPLDRHVVCRSVKLLCKRLGFKAPARAVHALRLTFATHYLRRGGSTFHLQKVLGHSTLEMTRRYANLLTEDLQAVHERLSLLFSR